jgi:hypothetical protein
MQQRRTRPRRTPWPAVALVAGLGLTGPVHAACVGDCNGDGAVSINELIVGVDIALGQAPPSACPAVDVNGDGAVSINELIAAVGAALNGCTAVPTATSTATPIEVMITLTGSCAIPGGRGGRGLKPCDSGTPVTAFRCDDRAQCLHQQGLTMVGATTVAAAGAWSMQIRRSDATAALVFQADITNAIVYRALGLGPVGGGLRAEAVRGVAAASVAITPITEAGVQLLDQSGFEQYSDSGAAQVIAAVDQATAQLSFESLGLDMAAGVALSTARSDPHVQAVLQSARNTPTPTPSPAMTLVPVSFAAFTAVPLGPPGCSDHCSTDPVAIAAGDFNGDGHVDIATANFGSDDITILLGDGAGALDAVAALPGGPHPAAIASGYLDGDLAIDLAVAAEGSESIYLYFGDGDGGFRGPFEYTMGESPTSIVLADFNGDGVLDVATADSAEGTVSVRLGDEDGLLNRRIATTLGGAPHGLAAAYVDDDPILDLLVTRSDDAQLLVLHGEGDGTFTVVGAVDVDHAPGGLAVADLNGDGTADVAIAAEGADTIDVLLGHGDGTFDPPIAYPVGSFPESVAIADFNRDGMLDLATADSLDTESFGGNVSVLLGNGDGTFAAAQSFAAGAGAFAVAALHLTADDLPDLVTTDIDAATVSVLLNTSAP